ncbi:hypothetical protein MJT46_012263 [Ovis ammon polii x Ovis aries]|nr:hypothetical protein MJT46_012263 [Ovis ammon polii x Ovis aries]
MKGDWSLHNSAMKMMRVTAKQKHQMAMDQLPTSSLPVPMLATSEKATQEENSCGRRRTSKVTTAVTLTCLTGTITMSWSSGLPSKPIMGFCLRVGQLLSTCVSFSLGASLGIWKESLANWCMFIWCLCFAMSLITSIVELCGLQCRIPCSWDGFLHAYSFHFGIICIVTSLIFGTSYIQVFSPGPAQNRAITATAFSCVAALLYAIEVAWVCVRPGDMVCFVPTFPGVLRRLENYLACVIFPFISNTDLYQHQPALVWCVAVYSICFLLGAVVYFVNGCDCDNDKTWLLPVPSLLWVQTVLSVLLYATAVILWPLYQFHEKLEGGSPSGPAI